MELTINVNGSKILIVLFVSVIHKDTNLKKALS